MTADFRAQLQDALTPAYELERELTGGGMSRVFVAVESRLRRRVVVKVLPPELAAGVNAERFRREIQLAAGLHHPHVVPLLSAGEAGNILYYTMPFIEGESLRSALRKRHTLGVGEVARILHDVVDALAYAHARGVVHRDIKPDNVLVSGKHAVVTDFGVAKALGSALAHHTTSGVTTAGVAIGTPAYMAPEQLAGDPAADHRVDLYAVGLLAYELLTGDSPFTGPSPQATMAAQLTRIPPALHECCPEVPEHLSAVVMRCLAKDPNDRPQTADELLDQLVAVTTPQGGALMSGVTRPSGAMLADGAPRSTPVTPVTPPATAARTAAGVGSTTPPNDAPPPRSRGDRALILGTLLVALGTAAALAVTLVRRPPPPPGRDTTRAAAVAGSDSAIKRRADLAGAATLDSGSRRAIVLSRAESIAIADAVRKRMEAEQRKLAARQAPAIAPGAPATAGTAGMASPATGASAGSDVAVGAVVDAALRTAAATRAMGRVPSLDSMRAEFQRVLSDSVRTALEQLRKTPPAPPAAMGPGAPRTWAWVAPGAARDSSHVMVAPILPPPRGERRRVAVMGLQNGTGKAELAALTARLGDSLRTEFIGVRGASTEYAQEYEMVDGATTRAAEQRAPNPVAVGFTLRADYVVFGMVIPARRDSLRVQAQVLDVRAGRVVGTGTTRTTGPGQTVGDLPDLTRRIDERIEREISRGLREEQRRRDAAARADSLTRARAPR